MEWILSNVKELVGGGVFGVVSAIWRFYEKHKDLAARIALRVEKDNADGKWTNEEKEKHAVELYFEEVIPRLPLQWKLFLKIVPNFIEKKLVISLVRKLCKKAKKIK